MASKSPLAKLYGPRQRSLSLISTPVDEQPSMSQKGAATTVKQMENVLEAMRDLPVQRLKDEMKELQVCHCSQNAY